MISNERQYAVTVEKRVNTLAAAESATDDVTRETMLMLADELGQQLGEYASLRDGVVTAFDVDSVDGLADALIKARVSRRWTQRQLAERLNVAEQMVQKDESGGYENAGLARLADIADVLGYELHGVFCLRGTHVDDRARQVVNVVLPHDEFDAITDSPRWRAHARSARVASAASVEPRAPVKRAMKARG